MKSSAQITRDAVAVLSTVLVTGVIVTTAAAPATARLDPGVPRVAPTVAGADRPCPLARVGTQLVRCDNLTGAGVAAPEWVPLR